LNSKPLKNTFNRTNRTNQKYSARTPILRSLVILNPHAAGGRAAKLQALIAQQLITLNCAAHLHISQSIEDSRQAISALPAQSRVVLIGGDGTLHHMLPAVMRGQHSLGLVPFGSGNDTARALGLLGMSVESALQHALQADAHVVDIGFISLEDEANTYTPIPFISSMAAGFDAAIALRAHQSPKWLIGLPRYLYATLLQIKALKRNQVSMQIDEVHISEAPVLFSSVLNTPTYGSGMPAVPQASIDDGKLNVLIVGEFGRLGALLMLPRLLAGKHLSHPRVQSHAFERLVIESHTPLPLAADGEPLPAAKRVQVRVAKAALGCVVKRRY
jgi:diacylglycerol kinase (ATP)